MQIFTTTALAMGIAFVNTLLMFYRARHAPVINQPTAPSNPMMLGANSLPPYWRPAPNPYSFDDHDQGGEFRRPWSAPVKEDTLEMPSQRRRLIEHDNYVKVQ